MIMIIKGGDDGLGAQLSCEEALERALHAPEAQPVDVAKALLAYQKQW